MICKFTICFSLKLHCFSFIITAVTRFDVVMETNPEKEVIENLHTALKASQQEVVNLQKKLVQTQRKLDKSNGSYEELRKEVTCHFV